MTDADASREMMPPASARPLRLVAVAASAAVLGAALLLWTRFGEGVYARMLVDAFIACF
jgi:hypothetical protein